MCCAAISQRSGLPRLDAPAQVDVNLQDGEVVELSVLQVLDDEHMEMAYKLRDQVAALSRLRAGALDGASSHPPWQRTR